MLTAILKKYFIHCYSLPVLVFVNCSVFVICVLTHMIVSRRSTPVLALELLGMMLVVSAYLPDTCNVLSSKIYSSYDSIIWSCFISSVSIDLLLDALVSKVNNYLC